MERLREEEGEGGERQAEVRRRGRRSKKGKEGGKNGEEKGKLRSKKGLAKDGGGLGYSEDESRKKKEREMN